MNEVAVLVQKRRSLTQKFIPIVSELDEDGSGSCPGLPYRSGISNAGN
jgi:hypothetical protein